MSKRLFVSILLPKNYKETCMRWQREFAREHPAVVKELRWTKPEQLHITARFLGDVDEQRIPALADALQKICAETKPFNLVFKKITFAPPHTRKHTMVWAVFERSAPYERFSRALAHACEATIGVKLPPEKELIPHVTIARSNKSIHSVVRMRQPELANAFSVNACELMRSGQDRSGAHIYHELAQLQLGET